MKNEPTNLKRQPSLPKKTLRETNLGEKGVTKWSLSGLRKEKQVIFFSMRSKSWEMKRIQYIGTSPFTMVSRTSCCRLIAIQRLRYKIWYRMTRTSPFGSSWRNGQPMIDFGPLFEVKWAQTSLFIMGLRIYGLWQGQTENPRIQSRNLAHRYP